MGTDMIVAWRITASLTNPSRQHKAIFSPHIYAVTIMIRLSNRLAATKSVSPIGYSARTDRVRQLREKRVSSRAFVLEMKMMNQETVNELFYYDNGILKWREAKGRALRDAPAGTNQKGYLITKINGIRYGNHRIIFLMEYGYWPLVVDHINGDTLDNRVENLREATSSQNMHNSKISRNNKSGIKGVFWNSAYRKWQGNVNSGGKQHFAGRFESIEDAQRAVINLRNKLHKEFVNHG